MVVLRHVRRRRGQLEGHLHRARDALPVGAHGGYDAVLDGSAKVGKEEKPREEGDDAVTPWATLRAPRPACTHVKRQTCTRQRLLHRLLREHVVYVHSDLNVAVVNYRPEAHGTGSSCIAQKMRV